MPERKSAIERLLSLAADVRPGEGTGVVLLGLNVFLLLGSYYLLKTVRESLILSEGGAEVKSYSAAGQAVVLLLMVPLYGMLTSRFSRMRVITVVMAVFIANLLMFYLAGVAGGHVGVVFFIWVGVFNNFAVAQFWSFANDLYSEEQGKRLFPIIGIGSAVGAVVGAELAAPFIKASGPFPLMLAAAIVLVACLLLTQMVDRRAVRQPAQFQAGRETAPLAKTGAFELLRRDRYLQLIAMLIVVLNIVNTTGEFLLGKFVTAEALRVVGSDVGARAKFIGEFYAHFFGWVNISSMLLQTFAVSRIFKYLDLRGALYILPSIALGTYSLVLAAPALIVVQVGKILENSTDYSVMNTARHALYLNTSREAKYKVKSVVDTFFVRGGDVLQAGLVYGGTLAGVGISGFAGFNVAMTLVWLGIVAAIGRQRAAGTKTAAAA